MSNALNERAETPVTKQRGDTSTDAYLKRFGTMDIESMDTVVIDNMIVVFRQQQHKSYFSEYQLPRKYRRASFFSLGGRDFFLRSRDARGMVDYGSFAVDMKNLQNDMERVGRDMQLGILHYVRSQK